MFDFSAMRHGLQGYCWDFPSLINGEAFMNRGLFDSRARLERPRLKLKATFRQTLQDRGRNLEAYALKGHPIYWFSPHGSFARPRILLAGDAAGVDPLFGEGISFALAYGEVAASAIDEAFTHRDFSLTTYKDAMLSHPLVAQLVWRHRLARGIYALKHPLWLRLFWLGLPLIAKILAPLYPLAAPLVKLYPFRRKV